MAVVTNVDFDHPDHFADACDVQRAFAQFLNQAPGVVAVVDADDAGVQATLLLTCARAVRCVLSETTTDASAQARAFHVQADWDGSRFRVEYQGRDLGAVRLNVGGRHNVRNALLAIVAGLECGAEFTAAARALERFRGVRRRFDLRGEAAGVRVYDDYAHHPREIEATLEVAAQLRHREGRRVVVVFQPHRYTRTRALADAFGRAFHEADVLVLTDVYAAGDKPIDGVDGRLIAEAARNAGHTDVDYCPRLQQVCDALGPRLRPGDVVLTLGAGDVTSLGPALLDWLRGKEGA